jgi:hypothetical protein
VLVSPNWYKNKECPKFSIIFVPLFTNLFHFNSDPRSQDKYCKQYLIQKHILDFFSDISSSAPQLPDIGLGAGLGTRVGVHAGFDEGGK